LTIGELKAHVCHRAVAVLKGHSAKAAKM
jgi:hypothetical protein